MAVAVGIWFIWPSQDDLRWLYGLLPLARRCVFVALLFSIGISSTRIGGGGTLRKKDWALHAVLSVMMIWSFVQRVGPFATQWYVSGSSLSETWYYVGDIVRLGFIVGVFSGIPIGVGLFSGVRLRPVEERPRAATIISIATFGVLIVGSWFGAYIERRISEEMIGAVFGLLLLGSFGSVCIFAARGDITSTRILLAEAALLGLRRLV